MLKTCAITEGFAAWRRFADEFNNTPGREYTLAQDYFNGPLWFAWGKALHDLLSSDTVPNWVNAGEVSRLYFAILRENGFNDEGDVL